MPTSTGSTKLTTGSLSIDNNQKGIAHIGLLIILLLGIIAGVYLVTSGSLNFLPQAGGGGVLVFTDKNGVALPQTIPDGDRYIPETSSRKVYVRINNPTSVGKPIPFPIPFNLKSILPNNPPSTQPARIDLSEDEVLLEENKESKVKVFLSEDPNFKKNVKTVNLKSTSVITSYTFSNSKEEIKTLYGKFEINGKQQTPPYAARIKFGKEEQTVALTCGGLAGKKCPSGYTCQYPERSISGGPIITDQEGKCVPDEGVQKCKSNEDCKTGYVCAFDELGIPCPASNSKCPRQVGVCQLSPISSAIPSGEQDSN